MDAASIYFGRQLQDRIADKQREMTKPLLMGQAIDYPDYRHRAGYLRGLADVLEWMKQISFEDEKREMRP
jgi:hypothetical protein